MQTTQRYSYDPATSLHEEFGVIPQERPYFCVQCVNVETKEKSKIDAITQKVEKVKGNFVQQTAYGCCVWGY